MQPFSVSLSSASHIIITIWKGELMIKWQRKNIAQSQAILSARIGTTSSCWLASHSLVFVDFPELLRFSPTLHYLGYLGYIPKIVANK